MLTRREFLRKSAILAGGVAVAATVPSALMAGVKKEPPALFYDPGEASTITLGKGPNAGVHVWEPKGTYTVSTSVGEVYSDGDKWRKVSDNREVFNFKKPLYVYGDIVKI